MKHKVFGHSVNQSYGAHGGGDYRDKAKLEDKINRGRAEQADIVTFILIIDNWSS